MSTTYSTIVNSSLLKTIHRVKRIQLQDDISSGNLNEKSAQYHYPRAKIPDRLTIEQSLFPDTNDIIKIIEEAKEDAFKKVLSLGMSVDISECENFSVQYKMNDDTYNDRKNNIEENIRKIDSQGERDTIPDSVEDIELEPQVELLQDHPFFRR